MTKYIVNLHVDCNTFLVMLPSRAVPLEFSVFDANLTQMFLKMEITPSIHLLGKEHFCERLHYILMQYSRSGQLEMRSWFWVIGVFGFSWSELHCSSCNLRRHSWDTFTDINRHSLPQFWLWFWNCRIVALIFSRFFIYNKMKLTCSRFP